MLKLWLFIVSCTLACMSCSPDLVDSPIGSPDPIDLEEARQMTTDYRKSGSLTCEDEGCEPAVGALWTTRVHLVLQPTQCTTFLVASDLVMTNSHCISPHILKASQCHGLIQFTFPKTPEYNEEILDCDEILEVTHLSPMDLRSDYALIKLNRPIEREPLQLTRSTQVEGTKVQAVVVSPIDGANSLQHRVQCQIEHRPAALAYSDSPETEPFSHVVLAENCLIEGGNSGGPVLNDKGRVVGLNFGKENGDLRRNPLNPLQSVEVPPTMFYSNLACPDSPYLNQLLGRPLDGCHSRHEILPLQIGTARLDLRTGLQ